MENIRIKLSVLWIARMLVGLQGDVLRYMEPGMLQDIIDGNLVLPVTNDTLAVMATMMMIPIFMAFLSLELKDKYNRLANIIIAIFFIVVDGTGFIVARPLYENILAIGYVVFCALIVWFAWKWPKEE